MDRVWGAPRPVGEEAGLGPSATGACASRLGAQGHHTTPPVEHHVPGSSDPHVATAAGVLPATVAPLCGGALVVTLRLLGGQRDHGPPRGGRSMSGPGPRARRGSPSGPASEAAARRAEPEGTCVRRNVLSGMATGLAGPEAEVPRARPGRPRALTSLGRGTPFPVAGDPVALCVTPRSPAGGRSARASGAAGGRWTARRVGAGGACGPPGAGRPCCRGPVGGCTGLPGCARPCMAGASRLRGPSRTVRPGACPRASWTTGARPPRAPAAKAREHVAADGTAWRVAQPPRVRRVAVGRPAGRNALGGGSFLG